MKLNLQCGLDIRNGYVNVNYGPVQLDEMAENTNVVVGDFRNLDPIVDDGVVEEIIFNPPLGVIAPNDLPDIINHWRKKLKDKGVLKIHAIDIRKVGRAAHSAEVSLQDIHNLIFGPNYEYRTVIDTFVLRGLLSKLGFKVETITTADFVSAFEVVKNAENNL